MQIDEEILLRDKNLVELIEIALAEDLGGRDVTSDAVITSSQLVEAVFIAKEAGVCAGLVLIPLIIKIAKDTDYIASDIEFIPYVKEGQWIDADTKLGLFKGHIKSILALERIFLNFVSRVSGVATYTNKMVNILADSKPDIYDTRKTIPGFRMLDKYGVACGGGMNHRLDLAEYLLIKDNHWNADREGVLSYLKNLDRGVREKLVEVEIDNINELYNIDEILNVDILMLDNFSYDELEEAITFIRKNEKGRELQIEVSGDVDIQALEYLKSLDIDRISMGKLTHSAPSFNISLDLKY